MPRPTRDQVLMGIAHLYGRRSTCSRLHVGAVASKDGRVLTAGYNGAPAGLDHCVHEVGESLPTGCPRSVHAEANVVAFAARHGVSIAGAELHVTHMPCLSCAMLIINSGLQRVCYFEPYRIRDGIELLLEAGVEIDQLSVRLVS